MLKRGVAMPKISESFGMTVQKHRQPHFHVRFGGEEAVFGLDGSLLEGDIGRRAGRLVSEWCAERSEELRIAWERASSGKEIPWVAPLR
jgi:hypothetical protein